jgi:all-trans-8'-apo-beta-carotenal 15,15'-oxygenase
LSSFHPEGSPERPNGHASEFSKAGGRCRDYPLAARMRGQPPVEGRGEHRFPGQIRRYRIDPAHRAIRQEILSRGGYEWPRLNELHSCHKYRLGYLAKSRSAEFFWSFIVRIDLQTGASEGYDFGGGCYCSEPVFAPQPGYPYLPEAEKEPGWLLRGL